MVTRDTEPRRDARPWPGALGPDAFHGLAGEVVRTLEPCSEADPAALLFQFLAAVGNVAGRGPHYAVGADRHGANLFMLLIGSTASGRKGSSWSSIREVIGEADPDWRSNNVSQGLSSGEGLIDWIRDPVEKQQPVKDKSGVVTGYQTIIENPGVSDKRLLITEGEFAATLRVMGRDGNTLSAVLRQAWDGGDLRVMTRNNPLRASSPHVSIIGHITADELLGTLQRYDVANGFLNRFLLVCSKRSKYLPDGAAIPADSLRYLGEILRRTLEIGRERGALTRDNRARDLWHTVYPRLTDGRPGLLGAAVSRAAPQVLRLSCLYALLDGYTDIKEQHLRAALECWRYAEESCVYVFGDLLGDRYADRILLDLRAVAPAGKTRTEIQGLFNNHADRVEVDRALGRLADTGMAHMVAEPTNGRPAERWHAGRAKDAKDAKKVTGGAGLDPLISLNSHPLEPVNAGSGGQAA